MSPRAAIGSRRWQPRALGLLGCFACAPGFSADPPALGSLTLDELSQIKIISVSRREETLSEVAAAVDVITGEDIRRSGALSLPEALRMAPGVDVARLNSARYAISIRGFNAEFSNKLLVLQDGRSLYTPAFSGTLWDAQDTFLEDIDRIEVIRGPGGTSWGANAVNGVINILTKDARQTQGWLVTAGGGTEERGFGGIRYGTQLCDHTWLRVYGKAFYRDETVFANGAGAGDDWYQARGGFRLDSEAGDQNHWTLQGDIYGGEEHRLNGALVPQTLEVSGGNLLGRWQHAFGADSMLSLQAYCDFSHLAAPQEHYDRDELDLAGTHHFALSEHNRVNWGLSYRHSANRNRASPPSTYDPENRDYNLFSVFAEDEIKALQDRLKFSAGIKAEHNDFTGWEVLPNARLAWQAAEDHLLWTAVSRGVRTPSISDNDRTDRFSVPPNSIVNLPNEDLGSEDLWAFEAGWRSQVAEVLSLELAAFYNDYDFLRTRETSFSTPPPTLTTTRAELLEGESYGGELAILWQACEGWRWQASYTFQQIQLHKLPGSTDVRSEPEEGNTPHHQFQVRSSLDLGRNIEFDTWVRYVDELPNLDVPAYVALDVRLAWRPHPNLEIAIVGQNLLDAEHPEFRSLPGVAPASEIQRSVYGKVMWKF